MRANDPNFVQRAGFWHWLRRDASSPTLVAVSVAAIAVALALVTGSLAWRHHHETRQLSAVLQSKRAELKRLDSSGLQAGQAGHAQRNRASKVDPVLERLKGGFADEQLSVVEAAVCCDAQLLNLSLDVVAQEVSLSVQADSLKSLMDYLSGLQKFDPSWRLLSVEQDVAAGATPATSTASPNAGAAASATKRRVQAQLVFKRT